LPCPTCTRTPSRASARREQHLGSMSCTCSRARASGCCGGGDPLPRSSLRQRPLGPCRGLRLTHLCPVLPPVPLAAVSR
jgi:hypothetical protein